MNDPIVIPIDPTDLLDRLSRVASADDVEAEVLERLCPDADLTLPPSAAALVTVVRARRQPSGLTTSHQVRLVTTNPTHTQQKETVMGFDHRYEEEAAQAATIVGRFTPGDSEFTLVDSADTLADRYGRLADPAGLWSPARRLHEWCQAVHDSAKRTSPVRIDRVTIDTTNGWTGVPGCPQVLFLQITESSPNYRKGKREAVALVYATPDEGRRVGDKIYSADFEDLILGAAQYFESDMDAITAAKQLRQAIRTLADSARRVDLVPDHEQPVMPDRPRRYGV